MSHGEDRQNIHDLTPGTLALVRDVSDASAEKAVAQAFRTMGLGDPSNPIETQSLFSDLRAIAQAMKDEAARADRDWTRRTRQRSEGAIGKAFATAAAIAVVGGAHAIWAGIKTFLPVLALMLIVPTPVHAATEEEVRRDCKADALYYCFNEIPFTHKVTPAERAAIIKCMLANRNSVSPACKVHLHK